MSEDARKIKLASDQKISLLMLNLRQEQMQKQTSEEKQRAALQSVCLYKKIKVKIIDLQEEKCLER